MVTLFNFQGSVLSELSFISFSILSHCFAFVKNFFDFFKIFFRSCPSHFSATAYLLYHIDFALSRTFFIFFSTSLFGKLLINCAHLPSVGRPPAFFVSLSLRQLQYIITPFPFCQPLFSTFFFFFLIRFFAQFLFHSTAV